MTSKAPLVAAVLTSLAVLTACTAAPGPSGPSTSSRSSTPSSAADQVTLHGVSMALPSGWSQGQPTLCGPVLEHTVTVHEGRPQVAACPSTSVRQPDGETVSLIEIFGAWGSMGWTGKQITFGGQPAWVTQEDSDGKPVPPCLGQPGATTPCPLTSSAADRLLSTTLALPWLNATIVIRDATSARTDELLAQVTVHAETFLTVPASASSMSVVWAGGYDNPKTTTSPVVIDSTLAALRDSPPLAVDHACRLPATLGPVAGGKVVTFVSGSVGVPCVYWLLGGADPAAFSSATDLESVKRHVASLPSNHSPYYAPVLEPTISTGVAALVAAARTWLAVPGADVPRVAVG